MRRSRLTAGRMVSAAATVFFLLLGTMAIQLHQGERSGAFGVFAFLFTFAGCTFLFGNEWYQIFVIPELSQVDPEAITALENLGDFTKYDMGALVAFLAFVLGWILYAISMLTAGVYSRSAPLLMTAGFILTPLSTVILSPALGGAIGNAVVGFAFILIGWETLQRGHQAK